MERFVIFLLAFVGIASAFKLPFITSFSVWCQLHHEPPPPQPNPSSVNAVTTHFFHVPLDHFNEQDTRTWKMRYMANDQYYVAGGPIFIMVGGEWAIDFGWLRSGHMHDMARNNSGYMFYTEHRYYGKSHPTPDASTENMKWLSVDQALADLASFINFIKVEIPSLANSKVILVGASYSAMMVTWMRQKYPHLIAGSWASSAPLLAKVDYFEYVEVMGRGARNLGGQICYDRIQEAFETMETLVWIENVDRINNEFNLCSPLDIKKQLDIWNFFSSITSVFAAVVQHHRDGDIEKVCQMITNLEHRDGLAGYAAFVRSRIGSGCLDIDYDDALEIYRDHNWGSLSLEYGYRQWIYQTCSEFGFYQTSNSLNQPFGSSFPLSLNIEICGDIFDKTLFSNASIHASVRGTNLKYGGLDPRVTNVYFTHGDVDPWSALGILEDYNEHAPVDVVPGASHCYDLYPISSLDTPAMKAVKDRVTSLVNKWIND